MGFDENYQIYEATNGYGREINYFATQLLRDNIDFLDYASI